VREPRLVSGRARRPVGGRSSSHPPYHAPGGHNLINVDSGELGIGTDDEHTLMLFEDGSPMLYEDGTPMRYES